VRDISDMLGHSSISITGDIDAAPTTTQRALRSTGGAGSSDCKPRLTLEKRIAALLIRQGGRRRSETQVTLGAGYPVRTPNPVTGRRVPGAKMLDLSGRERVETKPIAAMRPPWHPRPLIVGLRRTRAESERGSAERAGDCGCPRDFLHIHSWSPNRLRSAEMSGNARWRAGEDRSHDALIRYPSCQGCQPYFHRSWCSGRLERTARTMKQTAVARCVPEPVLITSHVR
jgi:hypothetical protein